MPHSIIQGLLVEIGKTAIHKCADIGLEIVWDKSKELAEEAERRKFKYHSLKYYFKVDPNGVVSKEYVVT